MGAAPASSAPRRIGLCLQVPCHGRHFVDGFKRRRIHVVGGLGLDHERELRGDVDVRQLVSVRLQLCFGRLVGEEFNGCAGCFGFAEQHAVQRFQAVGVGKVV